MNIVKYNTYVIVISITYLSSTKLMNNQILHCKDIKNTLFSYYENCIKCIAKVIELLNLHSETLLTILSQCSNGFWKISLLLVN